MCGTIIIKYWNIFGSQLLNVMHVHLMGFIRQGLSPIQVMVQHKAYEIKKTLKNEHVTHDTFVLPSNVGTLERRDLMSYDRCNHNWTSQKGHWMLKIISQIFMFCHLKPWQSWQVHFSLIWMSKISN